MNRLDCNCFLIIIPIEFCTSIKARRKKEEEHVLLTTGRVASVMICLYQNMLQQYFEIDVDKRECHFLKTYTVQLVFIHRDFKDLERHKVYFA